LNKAYSLDTSTCIDLIRSTNLKARQQFEQAITEDREIVISSIVLHELAFGVSRSKHPQRSSAALNLFLGGVSVLDFTADDAVSAGRIRANLTNVAMSIGPFDTLIAGQALRRDLIMVTGNVGEFSRVKHLVVVNWSR
jgi:tRNA(fMet)-specific endonuclease VapC